MKTENEKKTKPFLNAYMYASALGASRAVIGLPIEHPFDYVKTQMQAKASHKVSAFQVARDTYKSSGINGFYAGVVPNGVRMISKEVYRCPLITFLPTFYKQSLFRDNDDYKILQKGLTGVSIASIEVFAITPLERFKVWLMTREDKNQSLKDLLLKSDNPVKFAYQSLNIVYPRLLVSWAAFLMADEAFKSMARKYHKSDNLSYSTLAGIGVAVGIVNLAAALPFDMVETLIQKDKPWENQGVYKTMKAVHTTFGLSALYTGWRVRLAKQIIQSILNVNLLDALEENIKNSILSEKSALRTSPTI